MREARADGATSAPQEEADMPLVLTNQDQERAFVVAEAIEAMASGLRQLAHGDATRRPRIDNYCPTGRPGEFLNFSSMEGVVREPGYYALRIKPDVMSWPLVDGIRRKHTFNTRPGRWGGLVFLFQVQTGELLAILNDGFVQHARVAATAALGIRYLARPDARGLGIIGSGGMARSFAVAAAAVRPLDTIRVWSPNRARLEAYRDEMAAQLPCAVEAVASAREAVAGAAIASCCTSALGNVLDGAWVEPGMHVTNVTTWELTPSAYARVDVVGLLARRTPMSVAGLVDDDFGMRNNVWTWACGQPEERAAIPKGQHMAEPYPNARYVDCVDWASGQAYTRASAEEVTTLANSSYGTLEGECGQSAGLQGIQFATIGGHLYEHALALGLGTELPEEMFLQDIVT